MILQRLFVLVAILLSLNVGVLLAQGQPDTSYVWPIADHKGTVILPFGYVTSPKINVQVFNDGYFFAVPLGTPLLAMGDGVISMASTHTYLNPNMVQSMSFNSSPSDSDLRASGYAPEQIFGAVGLRLGQSLTVYYQGLSHDIPVKTGQKVKKGDVIGYSGYMKCFFDEPAIHLAASKQSRAHDIGRYLFGKDYVPRDTIIGKEPVYDAAKTYAPSQLKEDFGIFRRALEEGHPGLYTYTPKARFDRLFDDAQAQLDTAMTEDQFARLLSSLLAKIGCGHTSLIRSMPFSEANLNLMPIDIAFVSDTCFVIKDWRDSSAIAPGTEILSFDSKSALEVREALRALCTGDGTNPGFQDSWFNGAYFKRYLYLAYGPQRKYSLQVRNRGGEAREVTVRCMPRQEIVKRKMAALKKSGQTGQPDAVELSFFDSTTAYMKVLDFGLFDRDRITEYFRELDVRKPANLIIDLRGNPGGTSENLNFLYSFIADSAFQMEVYKQANKRGPYELFRYTDNYSPDIALNLEFTEELGKPGYFLRTGISSPQTQYRYTGKVYVLMDRGTFSAAAMLCGIMHRQKRATLIGEETGGAYYQINAEKFAYVMLKNLHMQVRVPLNKVVMTEGSDPKIPFGRGVMPDCVAVKSLDDYLDPAHDSVLEFAKSIVAHSN